jgi:hypothetical protein
MFYPGTVPVITLMVKFYFPLSVKLKQFFENNFVSTSGIADFDKKTLFGHPHINAYRWVGSN